MTDKWSSKSAASRFKHNIFYFLIKLGGRYAAYALLFFVVLFYTLVPKWRRKAYPYIERRFPAAKGFAKIKHVFRLNMTFGRVLVDRAVLGITGSINILSSQADQDLCRELHAKGKGLIIITAHAGCWQSAMSTFDFMAGEKYVVYKRSKEDVDKQAHEHGGTKQTVNFIDPAGYAGGGLEIIEAIEKNGIICTMGDREFGSGKTMIRLPFLGSDISIPGAVYRIAGSYGTPVIIVFFPFAGAGRFDSLIADHFIIEDKGPDVSAYKPDAGRFINALETFCEKYPYQFFNFYDMWRS
ncbi:Lauroyl/myristoyl acyltransferase [Parelusimicrobium proximum]|uniref:LpxL/LpxP family acyltransferase n=1 Tax=Parelusimicrobium proximum TaxID=3228953 RepID=UPI003D17C717